MSGTEPADVIAVDIGGTKIDVALVDSADVIHDRIRAGTPAGASAILDAVGDLIVELCSRGVARHASVQAVGVGAPGVIDTAAGVVRSATDIVSGWAGTPIRDQLAGRTGLAIAVANDVRAAALAAVRDPRLRDCLEVLHVSVGTGVGGALVRDGRLVSGPHAVTGEIAHLLVPATGALPCGCGLFDHLEAVVSGPAIAAAYSRATSYPIRPLTEVAARMRTGDPLARTAILAAARLLGRALAGLAAAVDVDAVTLGGGVVHGIAEFAPAVGSAFHADALPPLRSLPVLVPGTGPDTPLLGAAQLARDLMQGARS